MNKYLIGLAAAVLVVGGGVWFFKYYDGSERINLDNTDAETQEELGEGAEFGEDGEFAGSIFELSGTGRAYRCTASVTTQGITTSGVVFVEGDKIRGDFESNVPVVGKISSYMIADKDYIYAWTSLAPQGIRSPRNEESLNDSGTSTQGQSFDPKAPYRYNCQAQDSVEASLFVLPANVSFQEYAS